MLLIIPLPNAIMKWEWKEYVSRLMLVVLDFGFLNPLPLFLSALVAPILTYCLTGYCFDSDFSLPGTSKNVARFAAI